MPPDPLFDPFDTAPPTVQPAYPGGGGGNSNVRGSQLDTQIEMRMKEWATKGGAQAGGTGLRNLLCTVHEVLWPEANWQPKTLSALIQTKAVKDAYRKVM